MYIKGNVWAGSISERGGSVESNEFSNDISRIREVASRKLAMLLNEISQKVRCECFAYTLCQT